MGVSKNRGTPNSNRVFHYKPSILGYPYFWKHSYIHYISGKSFPLTSAVAWRLCRFDRLHATKLVSYTKTPLVGPKSLPKTSKTSWNDPGMACCGMSLWKIQGHSCGKCPQKYPNLGEFFSLIWIVKSIWEDSPNLNHQRSLRLSWVRRTYNSTPA